MEAPFPAVATGYRVREAVELLSGEGQGRALDDADRGTARFGNLVTRADLLESLVS